VRDASDPRHWTELINVACIGERRPATRRTCLRVTSAMYLVIPTIGASIPYLLTEEERISEGEGGVCTHLLIYRICIYLASRRTALLLLCGDDMLGVED
jgi:hypothetical protein